MNTFDNITIENIKEDNPNWLQILHHPYEILIIGGFVSGKTNALLNLIRRNLQKKRKKDLMK